MDSACILIKNTEIGTRAKEEESKKNQNVKFCGTVVKTGQCI